jgi:hypothetical protein
MVSLDTRMYVPFYLRNDIEPCIHLDNTKTGAHGVTDVVVGAKLEPQRQQSQGILQGILVPKSN